MANANDVWQITIYRRDSETPVVYNKVKHYWWEDWRLVISQYSTAPNHHYWIWPRELISHVKVEKDSKNGQKPKKHSLGFARSDSKVKGKE